MESAPERAVTHEFGNGHASGPRKVSNGHAEKANGHPETANGLGGYGGGPESIKTPNDFNGSGTPNSESSVAERSLPVDDNTRLFVLSASSESSIIAAAENLQEWLGSGPPESVSLNDLSYTLATRRSRLAWRLNVVASSVEQLSTELKTVKTAKTKAASSVSCLAFVFTGQGAQWHAMGRELIGRSHSFTASLSRSDKILHNLGSEWSLLTELGRAEGDSRTGRCEIAQPSTTAIQIALVDLLADLGIEPTAVVGHSSGEIAAAYAAGSLSHEAAIKASYQRGLYSALAKEINPVPGSMLAVGAGEDVILPLLRETKNGLIRVACVNSPDSITVSGDEAGIDELQEALLSLEIFNRKLKVDTAYHSHHMEKIAGSYLKSLQTLPDAGTAESGVGFYSSVTGAKKMSGFGALYWTENLVSKVRFAEALHALASDIAKSATTKDAANIFVEIGPHSALLGPIRQTLAQVTDYKFSYHPALVRNTSAVRSALILAGGLLSAGYPINMRSVINNLHGSDSDACSSTLSDLIPYPWDHSTKYWHESRLSRDHRLRPFPYHDLVGLLDTMSSMNEPRWRYFVGVDALPWLAHHVVDGLIIFPGSGYICMALEAMNQLVQLRKTAGRVARFRIRNLTFLKPVIVQPRRADGFSADTELQLVMSHSQTSEASPWEAFRILSFNAESNSWSEHCVGLVTAEMATLVLDEVDGTREDDMAFSSLMENVKKIRAESRNLVTSDEFYSNLRDTGNNFGPSFSALTDVRTGNNCGVSTVVIPDVQSYMPESFMRPHIIHPTTLDALNQLAASIFKQQCSNSPLMPVFMSEISISTDIKRCARDELFVAVDFVPEGKTTGSGTSWGFQKDENGELVHVFTASDMQLKAIGEEVQNVGEIPFHRRMNYRMEWKDDVDFLTTERFRQILSDSNCAEPLVSGHEQITRYIEVLAYKNPHMNILEIRAGTGDTAFSVLQALDRPDGLMVNKYCFTEVASDSFEEATAKFKNWESAIDWKTLDITKDPCRQGFEEGSYDLVVASDVFRATSSLSETMAHVRKLLKPGGRLVFVEPTRLTEFENGRVDSPQLSQDKWDTLLRGNSFNGIEVSSSYDHEGPVVRPSMMVSKAIDLPTERPGHPTALKILHGCGTHFVKNLGRKISAMAGAKGIQCSDEDWEDVDAQRVAESRSGTLYVVLDSGNVPILHRPTKDLFERIKALMTTCQYLLWVSFQEFDSVQAAAMKALATGVARVLRRENFGVRFVTLDVRESLSSDMDISGVIDAISNLTDTCFWPTREADRSEEFEYVFTNGNILVPRIHPDTPFNNWIDKVNGATKLETYRYLDAAHPLKLEVASPGLLSSLRFAQDSIPSQPLGPDELQLEARAYGVNFRDVFIALGQMLPGLPMVGECSGTVTAVGSGLQDEYKVGDRVMAIGAEPFASLPRVKGLRARVLPDSISFAEAASIPIVFLTAYHSLVDIARLEKGQTVLIQAASGGVGQAAIQIAHHIGAEIFATVGSAAKRKLIMDRYGIPESHIFSSRTKSFKQGVMRLTKGKGANVVLNSLAGEMLNDSWDCVAHLGFMVEIGKADIYKRSHLSMMPFDRSTTFAAVDLLALFDHQPKKMYDSLGKIVEMLREGTITAVEPLMPMPIENIEGAFRLIAGRKHVGKVVVEADYGSVVKAVAPRPAPPKLDAAGCYLIAGGLGDLGKKLCRLLATHGAGHIVTLSRRTLDDSFREEFEREIAGLGAKLHIVKCDITQKSSVVHAATVCRNIAPVRGVIQGSMVLRDRPFEVMTLDDYLTSLGPKVQGTLHVHDAFSSPHLDFFITMSSIACVLGSASQANYSAGNAFQDAFVHANAGKTNARYVSINIGAVEDSEAVTSLPVLQQERMRQGVIMMKFNELYKMLEYAMGTQAAADDCVQSIVGFDRQKMMDIHDTFALENPLFSALPYPQATSGGSGTSNGEADVGQALRNAKSMKEAGDIIAAAIAEKLSVFLDQPVDDIGQNESLFKFGLDSLISMELKNWMVRDFQVTLQVSELADAPGIAALAQILAGRSKLLSDDIRGDEAPEAETQILGKKAAVAAEKSQGPKYDCCRAAVHVKKQVVPDLEQALQRHLGTISHFATTLSELSNLRQAVSSFTADGSTSRKLHDQLVARANDPSIDNWSYELVQERVERHRGPIVFNSSFAVSHFDSKVSHTQSERAAVIVSALIQVKRKVEAGTLEIHWMSDIPMCTHSWNWLFNSNHEPGVGIDSIRKYSGNHCIVLKRGRAFKVMLQNDDGDSVPYKRLKGTFDAINEHVQDQDHAGSGLGILTTDKRDTWAAARQKLLGADPRNADFFKVMDTAAFLICLDDREARTSGERIMGTFAGDLGQFNRWHDKALHFVVFANGTSTYWMDHAMVDGLTVYRMNEAVHEAINTHNPLQTNGVNGHHRTAVALEEYPLVSTPEIDSLVESARARYSDAISQREFVNHKTTTIGKHHLESKSLPVRATFNIMIQLAARLFYGQSHASWEGTSLAAFHKGRIDDVQYVTESVAKFCAGQYDLLPQAVREVNTVANIGATGGGCYRLLAIMQMLWPEGEPTPALFDDPLYLRTMPRYIATSMGDDSAMDSATMRSFPEMIRVHYYVLQNESVTTPLVVSVLLVEALSARIC